MLNIISRYKESQVLLAAFKLQVFDHLPEAGATREELAVSLRCDAHLLE
ncbi:MAG: hypothetical protein GY757_44030, partial [bacterium]|nr:hypothetical protein [bacterium]